MPAASCTDPVVFDLSKDNGLCQFTVELTHDGVSTPPNCDGQVSAVRWNNTGQKTWYAHLPNTRLGPAVYRIEPGASGSETRRNVLRQGGLEDRSDVEDNLDLNETPPQPGERLLN